MKKVLALLLTVALVLSFVVLPVSAAEGVTYEQTVFYQTEKPLSSLPLTLEAEIFLPAGVQSGTIFGNYTKFISVDNQSFMIYDGHPRITYTDDERFAKTLTFSGVTIPENKWVHLTMVLDLEAQKAHCYLDGALAETLDRVVLSSNVVIDNPHLLGGDLREDNDNYFRGQIKSVAVYGDARTAEEVAKDAAASTPDPDGLLAAYAPQKNYEDITDLSGNGNHLKCVRTWLPRDAAKVEDYAYSFAVICDTQYMTIRYPEKLTKLYDWIVSNAAKEKMAFAIGLGDITDASTDAEWALTHPRTDLPGDSFVMLFGNAVSAAAWLQNGEIAVETAPACRRRGYARACAAALLSDALARGESPVYRCTARNVASRALAASLGLVLSIHEYCPGFRRG